MKSKERERIFKFSSFPPESLKSLALKPGKTFLLVTANFVLNQLIPCFYYDNNYQLLLSSYSSRTSWSDYPLSQWRLLAGLNLYLYFGKGVPEKGREKIITLLKIWMHKFSRSWSSFDFSTYVAVPVRMRVYDIESSGNRTRRSRESFSAWLYFLPSPSLPPD